MAAKKPAPKRTAGKRRAPARRKAAPDSRGLGAGDAVGETPPQAVRALAEAVRADGGAVIGIYREPLGGHWQIAAVLPLARVKPTAFQRDLSDAHVKRLSDKIARLDRFLDPIIAMRGADGTYVTPNGHHRSAAMQRIGARAITALVVPDYEVAYQILALNTEKPYNIREKALEAIRLARVLAEAVPGATEADYAAELEEASFLTLGLCYEQRPRFSGGVYQPVLRRVDRFDEAKALAKALKARAARAEALLELDERVAAAVKALQERGLKSPYLKPFVVARINPLRFKPEAEGDFDDVIARMLGALARFDPAKVQPQHVASMGGPPPEDA